MKSISSTYIRREKWKSNTMLINLQKDILITYK